MLIGIDASRASTSQRTGTEAYAYYLIRELIQLTAGQHHLQLYFNQPAGPTPFEPAPHVEFLFLPFPRLWTHLRLAWELHQRPPDVFFTPAHVIPLTYTGRSVCTVHDLGYHYFPEAHGRGQAAYLQWSTRHNARRGRLVLADSLATQADLQHWYNIHPDKIRVVYPGLALEEPTSGRPHNPFGHPYLLFLSTIHPRKNVGRLLEAFVQVAEKIPHLLVLAGKMGWHAEQIEQNLHNLPAHIQKRILTLGYVPEEDKFNLIRGATALLYPSLYEGFGFPVLEANACGTPVLTSTTSSLPELAGPEGALLVDPLNTQAIAEGILSLVYDHSLRLKLQAAGRANVQRFTWASAGQQTLAILEEASQKP